MLWWYIDAVPESNEDIVDYLRRKGIKMQHILYCSTATDGLIEEIERGNPQLEGIGFLINPMKNSVYVCSPKEWNGVDTVHIPTTFGYDAGLRWYEALFLEEGTRYKGGIVLPPTIFLTVLHKNTFKIGERLERLREEYSNLVGVPPEEAPIAYFRSWDVQENPKEVYNTMVKFSEIGINSRST